jgi:hypothetical protein
MNEKDFWQKYGGLQHYGKEKSFIENNDDNMYMNIIREIKIFHEGKWQTCIYFYCDDFGILSEQEVL